MGHFDQRAHEAHKPRLHEHIQRLHRLMASRPSAAAG
jgi:hypothetical protein